MKMKNYGIIVAAGKGRRMGTQVSKQYLTLIDKPVIVYTLKAFEMASLIDGIIVVIAQDDEGYFCSQILHKHPVEKPVILAIGGAERQYSVYNGLKAVPNDVGIVAIHDGARPLVTPNIIDSSIKYAKEYGGAVVGTPVKDTIKEVDKNLFAIGTPDRHTLWAVQTPQAFRYDIIMKAHQKAKREGVLATDDGMLVERLGQPVRMVQGSYENIKITTPEDVAIAEYILRMRKEKSCLCLYKEDKV